MVTLHKGYHSFPYSYQIFQVDNGNYFMVIYKYRSRKAVFKLESMSFNKSATPVEIMENLRQRNFDPESMGNLDNYLVWLSNSLWKFNQVGITVPNGTIEIKCQHVVSQLISNGFIELAS